MKYIFYISIYLFIGGIIYFNSCNSGTDTVTNTTNSSNCGPHHSVRYPGSGEFTASQYTNTFVDGSGYRVFQFSAIPFTTIDGVCTKSKPLGTGDAAFTEGDTTRPFNCFLHAEVFAGFAGYTVGGDYTYPGGSVVNWRSDNLNIGLQQNYGEGPGSILDFRVDVKFRSTGNLQTDSLIMYYRGFTCHMVLAYDEYRATDAGTGWQINTDKKDLTENFIQNVIKGEYLIGSQYEEAKYPTFILKQN